MIRDTHSAQTLPKQDGRNIYVIMKTLCPSGCHHNDFVATHPLGHMMYIWTVHQVPKCMSCNKATTVTTERTHCVESSADLEFTLC